MLAYVLDRLRAHSSVQAWQSSDMATLGHQVSFAFAIAIALAEMGGNRGAPGHVFRISAAHSRIA